MVNIRLYQLGFILVVLLINNLCYSSVNINSEKLILYTDKTESILGRPIRIDLYGINLKTNISDINLAVLNDNFGVIIDYVINDTSDNRWPNKKVQVLKFKIYPRQTGSVLIPVISTKNVSSQEKMILITSGKTSTPLIILPKIKPYEQQQIIVHVKVLSTDPNSRLSIDKHPVIDNFTSIPLSFERSKNKEGMYELKTGWALTALKSGEIDLKLPPVVYSVSGVSRKKFFLPSKIINIKTLPLYLPPTIPIGKISIQSKLSQNGLLRSNSVAYWNIKLTGNLNDSYKLPPILRHIKSNSQIKFLPVNSTRSAKITNDSLTSIVNYSIPFKALKSGSITLPEIQLQYFDPVNGKINTLTHKAKGAFVLNLFWRILLSLLLALIFIYIFRISYKRWQRFKFSQAKKEQAIHILNDNKVESIRESIKLLTEAEYWPKNITVTQWGEYWKNKYQVNNGFDDFIETLSSCFYSESEKHHKDGLSLQLLTLIKNKNKL